MGERAKVSLFSIFIIAVSTGLCLDKRRTGAVYTIRIHIWMDRRDDIIEKGDARTRDEVEAGRG